MSPRLFPAFLKYWRSRRGHSQLDLALAAGVSARHISFVESGRANASADMVLRLTSALAVPLRLHNEALVLAGFEPRFPEPALHASSPAVDWAIARMLVQQEPFPLTVLAPDYTVIKRNDAASRVFGLFVAEPRRLAEPFDIFSLVFDPALARRFISDWDQVAHHMCARLHRECLQSANDPRLSALRDRVLQYPGVRAAWRTPDFSADLGATLAVRLCRDKTAVSFMTTVTTFAAPRLVTLEEIRIESYFPMDVPTREVCERLALQDRDRACGTPMQLSTARSQPSSAPAARTDSASTR